MTAESRAPGEGFTAFRRALKKLRDLGPEGDGVKLTRAEAIALADRLTARLGAEYDHHENIDEAVVAEMGHDEYQRILSVIAPLNVGAHVRVGALGDIFSCQVCVFLPGEGSYSKLKTKELYKLIAAYQRATKDYLLRYGRDEGWAQTLSDEALSLKEMAAYSDGRLAGIFGVGRRTIRQWLKKALEARQRA